MGWVEGKGGRWVKFFKLAVWKSHQKGQKAKELSSEQLQDMAIQLVPPIGAILLTVTSQGWQNALQKSRSAQISQ